jgi:kynureninase
VSGIYIHEKRLLENESVLKGWWGVKEEKRFNMSDEFEAAIGIDSYQLSNAPIFNMVGLRASLEIYEHIDMERFHQEAIMLSKPYIDYIMSLPKNTAQIITPINENERGCQISVKWINKDKSLISQLSEEGIVADWREPNVMRVAFNPLYITTEDVEKLISTLKKLV